MLHVKRHDRPLLGKDGIMGEKWLVSFACDSGFHVNRRGLFTCRKYATWDRRLYFPSEGRHAVEFFARKIRLLRPGWNPRSWGPEASMLTTRHIVMLLPMFNILYFYGSSFRSMCAVRSVAVFCSSLILYFSQYVALVFSERF
jgi:hypothetical protein